MKKIRIYLATIKDSKDIWLWRNDKTTIFFSKNKKKINFKNHDFWFSKSLKDAKKKFYIGFLSNKIKKFKLGVVRFNIKKRCAIVSINLKPTMRGKKLSHLFLKAAINKFLMFKKIDLVAEIKKNNFISIKCFLKNRFILYRSKKDYNFYRRTLD